MKPKIECIRRSVRNEDQFRTYVALSSSSRKPLITLWTTSWCSTCHQLSPLLKQLVESGVGEAEGGVGYCEVEYDAPDVMGAGLGLSYMITSVPTLLSFDAGEAQVETKVADGNKLKDRNFLEEGLSCRLPQLSCALSWVAKATSAIRTTRSNVVCVSDELEASGV
ncbi:hypothetical protein VSDG_05766 [Cytospora chrysosperma]|uniref:Thioredoxin domain-containing protein n=1 Tax=Cytospora chrysosperma TaxID=252740 RepID=A0A423VSZ2_CYTCH|nr:hypothetical protein VSDG_05766 [Valsa sordida]